MTATQTIPTLNFMKIGQTIYRQLCITGTRRQIVDRKQEGYRSTLCKLRKSFRIQSQQLF
jgi:hypothetical protein